MSGIRNATWWAIRGGRKNSSFYKNEFGVTFLFATRKDAEEIIEVWGLATSFPGATPQRVRVTVQPY